MPAPASSHTGPMAQFAAAYHATMSELHAQSQAINTRMSQILSGATTGLTPQQQSQLDELSAARSKINASIAEYAMVQSMVLNQSADVAHLIGVVASLNRGLRDQLQRLNTVIQGVVNINAVLQTLNALLGAVTAIAGVL